jgi:hypothetical protein
MESAKAILGSGLFNSRQPFGHRFGQEVIRRGHSLPTLFGNYACDESSGQVPKVTGYKKKVPKVTRLLATLNRAGLASLRINMNLHEPAIKRMLTLHAQTSRLCNLSWEETTFVTALKINDAAQHSQRLQVC